MGRARSTQNQRLTQTRTAIGFVADLGGAAVALSMLAAGFVGLGSVLIGLAGGRPSAVFFGGGVVFGVGLGTVLMQLAHDRRSSSVEAQRGYRWVEAIYTYSIDAQDHHLHAQSVDVKIRALRDRVELFSNQYRWSGSGTDMGPVVQSPGHSLVGELRRSLGWRFYVVNLNPALTKGQATTVSIVQRFRDQDERFEPFLAKAVHETMDRLVLRVQLPPGLRPSEVWRVGREGAGPEARVVESTAGDVADNGVNSMIEWSILTPVLGLNYEIYWNYGNGHGLYDAAAPGSGTRR
jgi:hypothetical protein